MHTSNLSMFSHLRIHSVVLFLSLFYHLENGSLRPTLLSALTTITAVTGYSYKFFFRDTSRYLSAVKSGVCLKCAMCSAVIYVIRTMVYSVIVKLHWTAGVLTGLKALIFMAFLFVLSPVLESHRNNYHGYNLCNDSKS